jgi:hypothetical protein
VICTCVLDILWYQGLNIKVLCYCKNQHVLYSFESSKYDEHAKKKKKKTKGKKKTNYMYTCIKGHSNCRLGSLCSK